MDITQFAEQLTRTFEVLVLKAGVIMYTKNFNQYTWEIHEKKLDLRYFYFGRYFVHFLIK